MESKKGNISVCFTFLATRKGWLFFLFSPNAWNFTILTLTNAARLRCTHAIVWPKWTVAPQVHLAQQASSLGTLQLEISEIILTRRMFCGVTKQTLGNRVIYLICNGSHVQNVPLRASALSTNSTLILYL